MSGVNIEYKGESIATIPDTGSKTIKTQGKYCEGDILVEYEAPPIPTPTLITKQITANGTYSAEDDNADGYSEVTVDVPDEGYFLPNCVMYKRNMVFPSTITSFFISYQPYARAEYLERVDLSNINPNISFPQAMFNDCQNLKEIIFNNSMTYIPSQICMNCINLEYAVIPNSVTELRNQCFGGCSKLKLDLSLFIDPSSLPTLPNTFTLSSTITIYVANQQMLDAFSTATNWSTYADRFQIKGATP